MSNSNISQERYNKLLLLSHHYENQKKVGRYSKLISLAFIGLAWILSLFYGFTLPFFLLHFVGTAMWLYQYLSTSNQLKTWSDYLQNPMLWFLSIITFICAIYVLMAAGRCSPRGYGL